VLTFALAKQKLPDADRDNFVLERLDDFALSDRFGWTPAQIREMSVEEYHDYHAIIEISDVLAKNRKETDSTKQALKNR
jgi:hypothetical protein